MRGWRGMWWVLGTLGGDIGGFGDMMVLGDVGGFGDLIALGDVGGFGDVMAALGWQRVGGLRGWRGMWWVLGTPGGDIGGFGDTGGFGEGWLWGHRGMKVTEGRGGG